MSKKLRKVTVGFVVQEYVLVGDTFVCVGQEFTCGDDVTWESPEGEVVSTPEDHVYQSFEMEQPEPVVGGTFEEECWRNSERRRVEELRRDEKRGLYPGVIDPAN